MVSISLHDGLKQLAVSLGVKINLGKHVVSVEPENGAITLERGEVVKGDVVIGADGIHVSHYSLDVTGAMSNEASDIRRLTMHTVQGPKVCSGRR